MTKTAIVLAVLLTAASACSKPAPPPSPAAAPAPPPAPKPVSVTSVTLGSALGDNKTVAAAKDAFAAKDTIYASVATDGAGHAKLRALWTFTRGAKSAKVDETVLEIDATGPAVNEFHVAKPSGWPKGDYKVEIFLNGGTTPVATKTFTAG